MKLKYAIKHCRVLMEKREKTYRQYVKNNYLRLADRAKLDADALEMVVKAASAYLEHEVGR